MTYVRGVWKVKIKDIITVAAIQLKYSVCNVITRLDIRNNEMWSQAGILRSAIKSIVK